MIRIFAIMASLAMMVGCSPFAEQGTTPEATESTTAVTPTPTEDPVSLGLDAGVTGEGVTNTTNTSTTKKSTEDNNTPIVLDEIVVAPVPPGNDP